MQIPEMLDPIKIVLISPLAGSPDKPVSMTCRSFRLLADIRCCERQEAFHALSVEIDQCIVQVETKIEMGCEVARHKSFACLV